MPEKRIDSCASRAYNDLMASVLEIAEGYYAFDTEGVTISQEVRNAVDDAFRVASTVPSQELNISLADELVPTEAKQRA